MKLCSVCRIRTNTEFTLRGLYGRTDIERNFKLQFDKLLRGSDGLFFVGTNGDMLTWNMSSNIVEMPGKFRFKNPIHGSATPFGLHKVVTTAGTSHLIKFSKVLKI